MKHVMIGPLTGSLLQLVQ